MIVDVAVDAVGSELAIALLDGEPPVVNTVAGRAGLALEAA